MQKFLMRVLVTLLVLTGTTVFAEAQKLTPRQGVVRVKVDQATARQLGKKQMNARKGKLALAAAPRFSASLEQIQVISVRPVFPYSEKFAAQRAKFGLDQWYEIEFAASVNPEKAQKVMSQTPGVLRADMRVPMQQLEGNGEFRVQTEVPKRNASVKYPFNDPRLPSQWHYQNFGDLPQMTKGADINAFEAWKTTTGASDVLVAIIDGGVDYNHEDLAANMHINEAELNGTPGVDDDGNGYVDDVYGYNFCTNSSQIYPHSHGTHVAGTVAAVNNNGIGVCGVAGGDGTPGSGVRMISCQVFDSRTGVPNEGDFAAALVYAAEQGASIAQCSWGWATDGYYEQDVVDAVKYFTSMARSEKLLGGLCIFATGNSGENAHMYPACMPEVLSVASMTSEYKPAPYSVHGDWVSVIAPGGLLDFATSQGVLSTLPNNQYGFNEGTSMATPHVSGIAALVLSRHGSPTLPATTLRQQIETSVNDFYAANPEVKGLYGSGNVDAAKALLWGDGSAPEAVSDFMAYPAQNEITVRWTIPASSDNNVNHHIVYYSKTAFDAQSDLSKIPNMVADTKFLSSGDETSIIIDNLESLTDYYVALQAVDRWGNRSPLSKVVKATTNAGPKMTLDKSSLSLNNNGDSKDVASFNIGNDDEGLLKWSVATNTVKSQISMTSLGAAEGLQPSSPYSGKAGIQKAADNGKALRITDYNADDYPKELKYFNTIYAYIGESDKTLPNAMAQHFTVSAEEYPEGFNLTTLKLDGAYGVKPVMKIYKGNGMIDESRKLLEFTPSYFAYYYNINLPEQLWFAPGESFWVVVSFDSNDVLYPLGMAETNSTSASATNSFMSNDKGKTWTRLSEVLKGSSYEFMADKATWAITAMSMNPDWSKMLEITPSQGELPHGETTTVEVSTGDNKLCNGTYNLSLNFTTNESENNSRKLPVTLAVKGQKPVIKFNKVVDFGSLLVGQTRKITVELFNEGYGSFVGSQYGAGIYSDKINSTNANFKGPDYLQNGFQARSLTEFELTFAPLEAGSHSGEIVFTDKDGYQVSIAVQGAATEPSKIAIDPQTINVGELEPGAEPVEKTFIVKNEGKYPLQFAFPKFTDETVDGATGSKVHKFGYTWTSNFSETGGIEYEAPDFTDSKEITSQFSDMNYWSNAISLGFDFPYYGKTYQEVYVTSFGGIGFKDLTDSYLFPPLAPGSFGVAETGLISAFGSDLKIAPDTKIEYAKKDGKFFVNFKNAMAVVYDKEYTPISFHMALSPNGDVEFYYDNYDGMRLFGSGRNLFVGINDFEGADPLTVTSVDMVNEADKTGDYTSLVYSNFTSGSAVRIMAPSPDIVRSVTPAYGLITPGKELEIKATVAAGDDIYAGPTTTNLVVVSNDPTASVAHVTFNADIVGADLKPEVELGKTDIDLGDVFRTSNTRTALTVKNTGRDEMQITGVSTANGKVTVDNETPVTVAAGQSKDLILVIPTAQEGEVKDVVTVTTSCGTASANVRANVIGCPEFTPSYTELSVEMEAGTREDKPLTITNTGNAPLEFALTAGEMLTYTPDVLATKKVDYKYSSTVDDKSVKFDWVDIETNGLGEQNNLTYYTNHDYVEVELPFAFPFYGKEYSKMYVYNTGFVSFTKRNDDNLWPEPPTGLPGETVYTNLIAPYWGMHSMDQTKTAGTYHYVTDDEAVVSFMEYGNSMNIGVCFQLILHKDGTFKIQYKGQGEYAVIFNTFGVAGTSNFDGTDGVNLSSRYIVFDNAIEFSPVATLSLAPGSSVTADIAVDATNSLAGEYNTSLDVVTNVPSQETVKIPVDIKLSGEAAPVYPEDQTVEHTVMHQSLDMTDEFVQMGAPYAAYFTVSNEGTAPFVISVIKNDGPTFHDDWFDEDIPLFSVFGYLEGRDWITGEPNGQFGWQDLTYGFEPVTVGKTPARFAIPMMPNKAWTTPGEYKIPVTLYLDGADVSEKVVNVTFIVTEAPVMTLDKKSVDVKNVKSDYEGVQTLTITNDGAYPLTFTADLDLTGKEYDPYETPGDGGDVAPTLIAETVGEDAGKTLKGGLRAVTPFDYGTSDDYLNVPQDFDFRNALFYPVVPDTKSIYNYGCGNKMGVFVAGTSYTAPAEGFNISHIYTCFKPGALNNVDLKVNIVNGDDPGSDKIIGTGSANIGDIQDANMSKMIIIPLDKPVFVAPGQSFYVNVAFPAGEEWPATVIAKEEAVVSNRYMGYTENNGWFDVATLFKDQYGSLGYVTACLETSEGQPWAALLPESADGTVAPGESADVKIKIMAASAPVNKDNKAMLVLKGNDPALPYANVPVTLDKNAAPVITGADQIAEVAEGASATVNLWVTDPDGDALTFSISDPEAKAKFISATPLSDDGTAAISEDGMNVNVTGTDGAAVTMEIMADFGDEGTHNIQLYTADADGNNSKATLSYNVSHTNRAPEALVVKDVEVGVGLASAPLAMNNMFSDPDDSGKESGLTFTIEVADEKVASAFTSGNNIIFFGNKIGSTTAKVTAKDPEGLAAENTFNVAVLDLSGVVNVESDGNAEVWPVPMEDVLNIRFGFSRDDVNVALYSAAGAKVAEAVADVAAGDVVTLKVGNLDKGAYLLSVEAGSESFARVVIK